jgi:hypothetical protein
MSGDTLTLRDLFAVNADDFSTRVESGMATYKPVQNAQTAIAKESRAIQWSWVRNTVAAESKDILNLNVVDVLVGAWQKYMQIEAYADRTKYGAGETILVPLAEHVVDSKHQPFVEILLKDHEVGRVTFDLDFSLTLDGFVLKIRDAKIWEIQTGSGKGAGSLSLADVPLWQHELKPVQFPGRISLGDGIPLRSASASKS